MVLSELRPLIWMGNIQEIKRVSEGDAQAVSGITVEVWG